MIRYALLYIGLEQSHGWVLHPLGQASQCISMLTSEERKKGGYVEDSLAVALAVAARSSISGSTGRG